MSTSLEEEKHALLERMRASREDCRSRFPHEAHPGMHHARVQSQPLAHAHAFPRSHTFRFIQRHPYTAALAAGALIAAIPAGSVTKAVKGSAVITAGLIGNQAKILMMRELLPSMIRLMRPRKP